MKRFIIPVTGRIDGAIDWLALRCPGLPRQFQLRERYLRFRGAQIGRNLRLLAGSRIFGFEHLVIGHDSGLADRCVIALGPGPGKLVIGDDTYIGPECYFRNASHVTDNLDVPIMTQGHRSKDIVIGSHVLVGARCIFTGGAQVGDYAIIGAGSIVVSEIPAYSIALGNPARVWQRRKGAPSSKLKS